MVEEVTRTKSRLQESRRAFSFSGTKKQSLDCDTDFEETKVKVAFRPFTGVEIKCKIVVYRLKLCE